MFVHLTVGLYRTRGCAHRQSPPTHGRRGSSGPDRLSSCPAPRTAGRTAHPAANSHILTARELASAAVANASPLRCLLAVGSHHLLAARSAFATKSSANEDDVLAALARYSHALCVPHNAAIMLGPNPPLVLLSLGRAYASVSSAPVVATAISCLPVASHAFDGRCIFFCSRPCNYSLLFSLHLLSQIVGRRPCAAQ